MERRAQDAEGARDGGILSLAYIIDHHGGALDYDLMTRTRFTLDDLGRGLTARSLLAFVEHLDVSSATWQAQNPDQADVSAWSGSLYIQQLLAGIADTLRSFEWDFAQAHTKKNLKPYMPKPIPRPGVKDDHHKVYGRDPIPISEFDSWYYGGDVNG